MMKKALRRNMGASDSFLVAAFLLAPLLPPFFGLTEGEVVSFGRVVPWLFGDSTMMVGFCGECWCGKPELVRWRKSAGFQKL